MAQLANPVGELVGGQQQLQLCQAGELQSPETPGGGRVVGSAGTAQIVQVAGHRPLALAVHREAFAAALAGGSEQTFHGHSGGGINSVAEIAAIAVVIVIRLSNPDAETAMIGDLQRFASGGVGKCVGGQRQPLHHQVGFAVVAVIGTI